nr:MAG TPA: hypothetical protein [Caudoviricetes sp.]
MLPQFLHFHVLPKSPAPNIPKNPTFAALPTFESFVRFVEPHIGQVGRFVG